MNSAKLKVEFAKQEKAARRQAAPTELPVHDYLEAEVHTGEGWPQPRLDGEDHTVIHGSDSAPTAKISLPLLLDGAAPAQTRHKALAALDRTSGGGDHSDTTHEKSFKIEKLSPVSISSRQMLGSCKAITPPSTMKAVAKGLSSEMWHREELEDKRKHDLWVKENAERMAKWEGEKQDAKARIRQLEADLMESDDSLEE